MKYLNIDDINKLLNNRKENINYRKTDIKVILMLVFLIFNTYSKYKC